MSELEQIKLDGDNEPAIVFTIRTKKFPQGIRFYRKDFLNKELHELSEIVKRVKEQLKVYRVI